MGEWDAGYETGALTIEEECSKVVAQRDYIIARLERDLGEARQALEVARRDRDAAERTVRMVRTAIEDQA